jgi:hypothetical protein
VVDDPYSRPGRAAYLAKLPVDLASKSTAEYDRAELARYQHFMAHIGEAIGQCPTCGAYRADGRAPQLHVPGADCSDQDGWAL